MARARNIKPGFYKNEDLAECSVWARLMFPGLWMLADREGRLEDRPKRIKGELFPFDSVEVDPLLEELVRFGMIRRYSVNGANVIQIVNFHKHQAPHGKEADSAFPDEHGAYTVHKRAKNGCVIADSGVLVAGTDENPVPPPCQHSASTVPAQCQHTLNPSSLNPSSLNPEVDTSSLLEPVLDEPPPSSTTIEAIQTRCVEITHLLNRRGATVQPANPPVVEWARSCVSDGQLLQALELAQEARNSAKSAQPVNASYLDSILRNSVLAQPNARASPRQAKSDESAAFLHAITGGIHGKPANSTFGADHERTFDAESRRVG